MKIKQILAALTLLLLLTSTAVGEGDFGLPVYGTTIDKVSGRSGPSTDYSEVGTYKVEGQSLRLFTQSVDANGVCWVQVDVPYGKKLRRVYTGLKRFDEATSMIPLFDEGDYDEFAKAKVLKTVKALYGPGDDYDAYGGLTVDKGMTVSVVYTENGYAQVEFEAFSSKLNKRQMYRCWVSEKALKLK